MYIVYSIPNCDTTKKAMSWLDKHNVQYSFHDYKKEGISADKLRSWCKQKGWETVLNKKSTTYRELDEATKQSLTNAKAAVKIMGQYNSIIKRPVVELDELMISVGFDEKVYEQIFAK